MKTSLSVACVALLAIGSLVSLATPSEAKSLIKFKPPGRSAPRTSSGAGSRNGLVVLAPRNVETGLTTKAKPTIFLKLSVAGSLKDRQISFCLIEPGATAKMPETYYPQVFMAPSSGGVIQLNLAETALPDLQVGKTYRWVAGVRKTGQFNAESECGVRSAEKLAATEGAIERIDPTPALTKALKSSPMSQAAAYAAAGIWYDSLQTMAELRRTQPQDKEVVENWRSLLESGGLATHAETPFAACCQTP